MVLNMLECFRWYGPDDTVTLADIKQVGAAGVYTSLHQIPYGEVWSRDAIRERIDVLKAAGLEWAAVESLPVSENIKTRSGAYREHIENYKTSLRNLGAEGVRVVIYNFMPVLDWVRTDLSYRLPDGTECLRFDPVHFAAFEIYCLERVGAEDGYSSEQLAAAKKFYDAMDQGQREQFVRNLIDVFPGCKLGLSIEDLKKMLAKYDDITEEVLRDNLRLFLESVIPVAEEAGCVLAVHPDDPPFSILGLSRIVSCENDVQQLLAMVDSPSNGLCFCTGSYSPRVDNDLVGMIERYGNRINAVHLRSTQRLEDGSFYEASHLEGSVDMYGVVRALLKEEERRLVTGDEHYRLHFRPDHGVVMLDDLAKPAVDNPGYTCLGRMRGLAEIRGLEHGIIRSEFIHE